MSRTPGYWHTGNDVLDLGASMKVYGNDGIPVAYCYHRELDRSRDECIANANFAATAPELLAACKLLIYILERNPPRSDPDGIHAVAIAQARRAIAKAKGEPES
jgi:hypothetical protein